MRLVFVPMSEFRFRLAGSKTPRVYVLIRYCDQDTKRFISINGKHKSKRAKVARRTEGEQGALS